MTDYYAEADAAAASLTKQNDALPVSGFAG
jgi:hypothetical protein